MAWTNWPKTVFGSTFFWITALWLYCYLTGANSTPFSLKSILLASMPITRHFEPLGYVALLLELLLSSYVMTFLYAIYLIARIAFLPIDWQRSAAILTALAIVTGWFWFIPVREHFWLTLIERRIITTESYNQHGECFLRKTSSKGEICFVGHFGPEACSTLFGYGATDISDDEWNHLWENVDYAHWIARPITSRGGFVRHVCFG